MRGLSVVNPQDGYTIMLNDILNSGEDITVRGRPTKEVLLNVFEVSNPLARCILTPGRKWNPWLALSEGLWLLSGRNDIESLRPYNNRIDTFSDDGEILNGAYGARLEQSIRPAIRAFEADINTRRVVLPIYEWKDLVTNSKDIPCNTSVMLKVRDGKLHMVVTNRSNDIHWGLFAVNLCQFSMLLEAMAACINVEVGTQSHVSHSFHVYTDEHGKKITDSMYENFMEYEPDYPELNPSPLIPAALFPPTWDQIVHWSSSALDNNQIFLPSFFAFARKYLSIYKDNLHRYNRLLQLEKMEKEWGGNGYEDWFQAGKIFLAK